MINLNRLKDNIRKIISNSKTIDFRGAHLQDDFLSYMKGYSSREKAVRDSMGIYLEVDRVTHALFPVLEKPASKPGYVTYHHDYFEIETKDKTSKANLEEYFLDEYRRWDKKIYGHAHTLADFFEFIFRQIIVDGIVYYAFTWEKIDLNNKEYYLPEGFHYLDPSTMSIRHKNSKIVGFEQKYSWWTILTSTYFEFFNRDFKKDQVLFVDYPLGSSSPAQESLKHLPRIKYFWNFGLQQGQASLEPQNHSLDIEKTRYKTYQDEKREYDITRAKIRRNFYYLYENVHLTSYYDVYTVVRYRKYLNDMRDLFVNQFNEQVLKRVSQKNKLKETPRLVIKKGLFMDNATIDAYFEQFKNKQISIDEFVEKVIKKN